MVLKAKMRSQETEPCNFYSSLLIQAEEEDIQSSKFEAFLSHHAAGGCQDLCCTTVNSGNLILGAQKCEGRVRRGNLNLNTNTNTVLII